MVKSDALDKREDRHGIGPDDDGMWATPAFGEYNHDHPSQQQRGQYQGSRHPSMPSGASRRLAWQSTL
ncbi:hypothetical protein [Cupriavidus sp. CuC1]|uniref:hypothetical protein n=1 Tax=Cupriavidus sp. CuC1 TaxID=3373131 RepID=UPI0037CD3A7F